jgi:hypothetical protein
MMVSFLFLSSCHFGSKLFPGGLVPNSTSDAAASRRANRPGQMARDLGLIEPQSAMEIADTDVAFGQQVQEAQARGIGERLKEQMGLG